MDDTDVIVEVERLSAAYPPAVRPVTWVGVRHLVAWLAERGEVVGVRVAAAMLERWAAEVAAGEGGVPYLHLRPR